jgi:cytochrome c oxidase assembly protein subunit 11
MVTQAQSKLLTMRKLLIVAVAMFGFGYALVPFYLKICEVTGVNSVMKADEVANTQIDMARFVTIEFDSNLRSNLPWTFRPLQTNVRIHPGELTTVMYEIRNNSGRAVTGQAIPSYGPQVAGRYFKKLDCFCFTQQTLQPGEVRWMPVAFVIEKGLPDDVNTITLSYTFFEVEGTARQAGG